MDLTDLTSVVPNYGNDQCLNQFGIHRIGRATRKFKFHIIFARIPSFSECLECLVVHLQSFTGFFYADWNSNFYVASPLNTKRSPNLIERSTQWPLKSFCILCSRRPCEKLCTPCTQWPTKSHCIGSPKNWLEVTRTEEASRREVDHW